MAGVMPRARAAERLSRLIADDCALLRRTATLLAILQSRMTSTHAA